MKKELIKTAFVIPPEIDRDHRLTEQGKAFKSGLLKGYEEGFKDGRKKIVPEKAQKVIKDYDSGIKLRDIRIKYGFKSNPAIYHYLTTYSYTKRRMPKFITNPL